MSKSEYRYWFQQSIRQKITFFIPEHPFSTRGVAKKTQQLVRAKSPTKLHHHKPIQSLNSREFAHPRDQRVHHNWLWVYFSSDYVYFNNYNINQLLKREIELNFNWLLLVLTTFGFVCEVFFFVRLFVQYSSTLLFYLVSFGGETKKRTHFHHPPNHSRFPASKKLRWYVHFAQRCKKARKVFGKIVYFLLRDGEG